LKSICVALVIWALFSAGGCGRPTEVQSPGLTPASQVTGEPLKLTGERPIGTFKVSPETVAAHGPILETTVSNVVNPAGTSLSVIVYLGRGETTSETQPRLIEVGRFSLYPPDRPGKFLLRSTSAFNQLITSGAKQDDVQLVFEMKRDSESAPWTGVELTIDPPKWLREESR
jgi:hypothetical protein